ncbi:hypothetical protein Tco_0735116 [Tanacetum coccineum]
MLLTAVMALTLISLHPEDAIEVEDTVEPEDKDSDGLLLGLMRSVKEGTVVMENLVGKLGNVEERVECKKLKKELEEARPNEAIDVPVEDEDSPSSEPRGTFRDS